MYPNKFVLLQNLKEYIENNIKYIDEVALIKVIEDEKEATDLLIRCRGNKFVYHTDKKEISMEIVNRY